MFLEIFQLLFRAVLRVLGFGLKGVGEFESDIEFRRKINSRIQKEKDEGLPLFDESLHDVQYYLLSPINHFYRHIKLQKRLMEFS